MTQTIRLGIVGTGMIAQVIAQAIANVDNLELIAVSSRKLDTAQTFAHKYGVPQAFDSWEKMVVWEGIDAIYVAVPTAVKELVCIATAQAHKHLLADKPFANLASLQRITGACQANHVAFMDATHFVHHPRIHHIHQHIVDNIGVPQAVRTAFFFPLMDRTNIRFDPKAEPTGALGDMGWYSMRAVVEFLPTDAKLTTVEAFTQRDQETNAIIRAAGLLAFENGMTSTWDVGYNTGVCMMDLDILGTNGMISMDDFVLDWAKGFPFDNPSYQVGYTVRNGVAVPDNFQFVSTPSAKSQQEIMIENFAKLINNDSQTNLYEASITASEKTQYLLDKILEKVNNLTY